MKSLFNFYLEDGDKYKAMEKLEQAIGSTSKGALSAYLRLKVKELIITPVDELDKNLIAKLEAEGVNTFKRNDRSRL